MPCDTVVKKNQTKKQRAEEIRETAKSIGKLLVQGRVRVVIGKQGAIAFVGLSDSERNGMTDACIYRRIMAGDSAMAKQAIAKAEMLAGRQVNKLAVGQGIHSHDGGMTWHPKG